MHAPRPEAKAWRSPQVKAPAGPLPERQKPRQRRPVCLLGVRTVAARQQAVGEPAPPLPQQAHRRMANELEGDVNGTSHGYEGGGPPSSRPPPPPHNAHTPYVESNKGD